jgi:hypothetical protein
MTKLIEVLTGVEIYQIPDMFGHAILKVHLEKIEDLLLEDYSLQAKNENELNFNTRGFADAISSGFIPAIECFFVHRDFVTEKSLEYENLRAERMSFVTTKYANRVWKNLIICLKNQKLLLLTHTSPTRKTGKQKSE